MPSNTASAVCVLAMVLVSCTNGARPANPPDATQRIVDNAGDLTPEGHSTTKPPGPDLKAVAIRIEGRSLTTEFSTFEEIGQLPALKPLEGPSWSLQIWTPFGAAQNTRKYLITVLREGRGLNAANDPPSFKILLCNRHDRCNDEYQGGTITVDGATLTVRVPLNSMPELQIPFEWVASSSWYGVPSTGLRWFDRVPNAVGEKGKPRAVYGAPG